MSEGPVPVPQPRAEEQQPAQAPPQAPQTMQAVGTCGQCKGEITLIMPSFRVMNTPDVSLVVLVHEKVQTCTRCGAGYVPTIQGISPSAQLMINWAKVEYKQQPLIVPPTAQQKNVVEKTKSRGLIIP